jgi:hypothetical protein
LLVVHCVETKKEAGRCSFYDPDSRFDYAASGYATADALPNAASLAAKKQSCVRQAGEAYSPCAHAQLEVWSGQSTAVQMEESKGTVEFAGGNGMVGGLGWYVSESVFQKDLTIATFHGLKDATKTKTLFKKPVTWFEYCLNYSATNCTATDLTAQAWPLSKSDKESYFKPDTFTGFFVQDDIGHFIQPPCDWSTYAIGQIKHNDLALTTSGPLALGGYSYSSMLGILEAAVANDEAILMWWWEPTDLLSKFTQDPRYALQKILLPRVTAKCEAARSNLNSTSRCSTDRNVAAGDPHNNCDQAPEALFKVFSANLEGYNQPAHEMLSKLQVYYDFVCNMSADNNSQCTVQIKRCHGYAG